MCIAVEGDLNADLMTSHFHVQFSLYVLLALGLATGAVWWAARMLSTNPDSKIARLFRHPQRVIIALGCVLLAWNFHLVVWVVLARTFNLGSGGQSTLFAISMMLTILDGVLLGFAGACFLAPPRSNGEPATTRAFAMAATLVLIPALTTSLHLFQSRASYLLVSAPHIFLQCALVVVIFALTSPKSIIAPTMDPSKTPPATPPPIPPKLGSPGRALAFGFAPAGMILLLITCASSGLGNQMSNEAVTAWLILGCIASIVCCFVASFMLFKRKTGAAIAGGILLMLLNAFIAFFFGCTSTFIGAPFH
jgi:hypothetical protein